MAFAPTAMHNAPPAYEEARSREWCIRPPSSSLLACGQPQRTDVPDRRCDVGTRLCRARSICGFCGRTWRFIAASSACRCFMKDKLVWRHHDLPPGSSARSAISRSSLVKNFAAQAVIAIENARLLNELSTVAGAADSDRRRSPRLSAAQHSICRKVLDTLVSSAAHSMPSRKGVDYSSKKRGGLFIVSASYEAFPIGSSQEYLDRHPLAIDRGNIVGSSSAGTSHDTNRGLYEADREFTFSLPGADLRRFRTLLGVPMMRQEKSPVGVHMVLAQTYGRALNRPGKST